MFAKCANPDCGKPFDYREGQLVRFNRTVLAGSIERSERLIEHFWLCGSCSEHYFLSLEAQNIEMKLRNEEPQTEKSPRLAAVA